MKKIIISAFILAISAPAMAALDLNQGGFYGSVEAGNTGLSDSNTSVWEFWHLDNFSYNLRGGYEAPINQNIKLGLELGYRSLADISGTSICSSSFYTCPSQTLKQHAEDLLATTSYDFGNGLGIFGKAGAAYVSQTVNDPYNTISEVDDSAIKPEIAAGLQYQFNPHVAVTGTVYHIFGAGDVLSPNGVYSYTKNSYSITDSTSAMVGLKVNF